MPSKKIEDIDLGKEILIRVGNPKDKHVLPWETLKKVGNSLEALFKSLAKNSPKISDKINAENFKLDFSGFYDGSAIPAFSITENELVSFDDPEPAKREILHEFQSLMEIIDSGDFRPIAKKYDDKGRNDIVKKLSDFSNSAGRKPLSIVRRIDSDRFERVYKVRKINKQAQKEMMVDLEDDKTEFEESTAVARMRIFTDQDGNVKKKQDEIVKDKNAIVSLKFEEIDYLGTRYVFAYPVYFEVYHEGGGVLIENEQLDICASGKTETDAKIDLFSQFDYNYEKLSSLGDEQLSNRLQQVKLYINTIVKSANKE